MRPRRWEHSRSEAVAQALRDGPSEAQLDAALRQLPDAPLPVGFVARAVEEATGWPRFRIEARDVVLPSTVGASTALSVGLVARAAGGEGPLWLQQVALWLLSWWSDLTSLPPPPAPVTLLLATASAMLLSAAWVLTAHPLGAEHGGD